MPRTRKEDSKDPTVEDVLENLGVDGDLDPDAAALDHAARFEALSEEESEAALQRKAEQEAEDAEPEEVVELPEVVPIRRSTAKPAERFPIPKKPTKAAPPELVVPKIEEAEPLPFAVPPPPTVTGRPKAKVKSPSTSRMGKGLADKVPGAEQIKLYKREVGTGRLSYIGPYTLRDLQNCTDIEDFIIRYVKETYGAGEYVVKGVDGHGREMELGNVNILGAPHQGEASSAAALMQSMFNQQQQWMREERERMQAGANRPGENPVTMLRDVMALSEMATKEVKEEKKRAESAVAEASNNTMQMMMMMMQQSQQQMMQMMAALSQPKEDPVMKMLLAKLVEDKSSSGGPLPPPPPPPADPMEGLAKMVTALGALMAPILQNAGGGGGGGDDEYKTMLKEMVVEGQKEKLTVKDIMAMMQEMRQERGTDDFKKSADNVAMMLQITNQMKQATEGGAAAGFFDALAALFGNRDFAGSIAQSIRAKANDSQSAAARQQQQQALIHRQALLAAQQQQEAARAAQAQAAHQAQPEPKVKPAPQPDKPNMAPGAGVSVEPRKVSLPPLPANTGDYVSQIALAEDDASLVEGTVKLLMYLGEYEDWQPFIFDVLREAQNGNQRATVQKLSLLLDGLVNLGFIDMALGKRILLTVHTHFADIHKQVAPDGSSEGIVPEEDEADGDLDYLSAIEDESEEEPSIHAEE